MGLGPKVRRHVDDALPHARKIKRPACRRTLNSQAIGAQSGGLVPGEKADLGNCGVADRKPQPGWYGRASLTTKMKLRRKHPQRRRAEDCPTTGLQ